ncbi:MAG: NADH-quinone oxidoreductase subunit J [Anaerolineales bacterium]
MDETLQWLAFIIFALMTLAPAVMVVIARNLFHSALYLLLSLFGVAGLFVLLVAPFLAAIQVLVYMGAIGILIVFGVMLTRGMMRLEQPYNSQRAAAAFTAVVLFTGLALTLTPLVDELGIEALEDVNADMTDIDDPDDVEYETVRAIGLRIADRDGFVLPFELASLLLTAAMIGAIVVAREDDA